MPASWGSLCWVLQPYFHLCLTSHFFPCQMHQGSKDTLFRKERGSLSVPSQQNWPRSLPIHPSLQITTAEQQSDVSPPSSSGSPEAPWGDYTNHTSLWKWGETCSHSVFQPALSALKVKAQPLWLCPEWALFLSMESNCHISPSYLSEFQIGMDNWHLWAFCSEKVALHPHPKALFKKDSDFSLLQPACNSSPNN